MVRAGLFAVATDLVSHLAFGADNEAAGGKLVEVGTDTVGRHEAAGAAPVGIGFVLEGKRFAHLVERRTGAAADMAFADDREFAHRRQSRGGAGFAEQRA